MRRPYVLGLAVAVVASGAIFANPSVALAGTTTYSVAGVSTFTVPAGVTSLSVQVKGGNGGNGATTGGSGALVSATVTVTPGEALAITVGANGGSDERTGGGGAYSALARSTTALVVAGAGGGGSDDPGGAGGTPNGGNGAGGDSGGGATGSTGGAAGGDGGTGGDLGAAGGSSTGGGGGGGMGMTRPGGGGSSLVPAGGSVSTNADAPYVTVTYTSTPATATPSAVPETILGSSAKIPTYGTKKVTSANPKTTTGQSIRTTVTCRQRSRGDIRLCKVVHKKNGATYIKAYGIPLRITITWRAAATATSALYIEVHKYKT